MMQVDDVKVGDTRVRVSLPVERTIAGKMTTADGEPATGYRVRALRTSNPDHDLWYADVAPDGRTGSVHALHEPVDQRDLGTSSLRDPALVAEGDDWADHA